MNKRGSRSVTIASRIWAPEPAAAAFRLRALARGLVDAGARVRVHTSRPPAALADEADRMDNSAPFVTRRHRVRRSPDGYLRGYFQYLSFDVPLLWHLLREPAPDIYVSEPPPTTGAVTRVVSTIKRRPYVYYAADVWSDAVKISGVPGVVATALRLVESWALTGARRVIAVNADVAHRVRELGGTDVSVVHNGVDTAVFSPSGPHSSYHGERIFLYAGTMSEWQGCDVFIRAFAQIVGDAPDVKLVFVGQGNAVDDLARLRDELGLQSNVDIGPPVDASEVAKLQRDALASLVSIRPGIGYDFAYPTKAMAAWACGTPVIYAGVGLAVDPINDHNLGWACEHDADAVATAMKATLDAGHDPVESARIATWAQENVSLNAVALQGSEAVLGVRR